MENSLGFHNLIILLKTEIFWKFCYFFFLGNLLYLQEFLQECVSTKSIKEN